MTLTRCLVTTALILGAAAALLAFGNPQWHPFVYRTQVWLGDSPEASGTIIHDFHPDNVDTGDPPLLIPGLIFDPSLHWYPPENYTGTYRVWDLDGDLLGVYQLVDGEFRGLQIEYSAGNPYKIMDIVDDTHAKLIFHVSYQVDRRAEFGIPAR